MLSRRRPRGDRGTVLKPGTAGAARACRRYDYADLYCAFNAHSGSVHVRLPRPPHGCKWSRLADTNLPAARQWVEGGNKGVEAEYTITGRSSVLLMSKAA